MPPAKRKRKPAPVPSDGFQRRVLSCGSYGLHYILMEDSSFDALKEIAKREGMTPGEVCRLAIIKRELDVTPSRALRRFILEYFREAATEEGHQKAGHGLLS